MSIAGVKLHKHQQLTDRLRRRAITLAPGDRFPSQNELIREYGVSDRTVLRSLTDLQSEGLIYRRNGRGTFVAERTPVPADVETLAVVATAKSGFFGYCIEELTTQAEAVGLRIVCHFTANGENPPTVPSLLSQNPSACLLFSYPFEPLAQTLQRQGMPVVVMGVPPPNILPTVPCVFGDHHAGGAMVMQHLLQQGHRRFAYATPNTRAWFLETRRYQATKGAMASAGISDSSLTVLDTAMLWQWAQDEDAARAFFCAPDAPTALVLWNDLEAGHWFSVLRKVGLRVPDDMAVVGYDNLPIGLAYPSPLDTVDSHLSVQIRYMLEILRAAPSASVPIVSVSPTFLRRQSSAPPTARRSSSRSHTCEPSPSPVAPVAGFGESSYSAPDTNSAGAPSTH